MNNSFKQILQIKEFCHNIGLIIKSALKFSILLALNNVEQISSIGLTTINIISVTEYFIKQEVTNHQRPLGTGTR